MQKGQEYTRKSINLEMGSDLLKISDHNIMPLAIQPLGIFFVFCFI